MKDIGPYRKPLLSLSEQMDDYGNRIVYTERLIHHTYRELEWLVVSFEQQVRALKRWFFVFTIFVLLSTSLLAGAVIRDIKESQRQLAEQRLLIDLQNDMCELNSRRLGRLERKR